MASQPSIWLCLYLGLAVSAALFVNATLDDPFDDRVPGFEAVAEHIGPGEVGFVTSDPAKFSLYRFHQLRYAIAPRVARREGRPTRSDWIVSHGGSTLPGYDVVLRVEGDILLLRRR